MNASLTGSGHTGFGYGLLASLDIREPVPDNWSVFGDARPQQCRIFLDHYKAMVQTVPFGLQLPETTLEDLRLSCPILLLSVILTASSSFPGMEKQADDIFRRVLADRVIVKGQQSLELFQSLLIYLTWYHHRFDMETQQYYQFLQLANGMAADLGLPKKFAKSQSTSPTPTNNVNEIRAFLLCYYLNCGAAALGFDRPETMQCIASLRNAAHVLVQISNEHFDQQAIAVTELMHLVAQHQINLCEFQESRVAPKVLETTLQGWRDAYPQALSSPAIKSSFHFITAYGILKSVSSSTPSTAEIEICLSHFETLLSNMLEQGSPYMVNLGIVEWSHLITTLFLLVRLEVSSAITSDHAATPGRTPVTKLYLERIYALVNDLEVQARISPCLLAPTLLGWLHRILEAVKKRTTMNDTQTRRGLYQAREPEESAYELVNSFIQGKGQMAHRMPENSGGAIHGNQNANVEDFWTDFMSDWLNW